MPAILEEQRGDHVGWSKVSERRSGTNEVREVRGGQNLLGHYKDFDFYSDWNGAGLEIGWHVIRLLGGYCNNPGSSDLSGRRREGE